MALNMFEASKALLAVPARQGLRLLPAAGIAIAWHIRSLDARQRHRDAMLSEVVWCGGGGDL
jgi:hypothetical protein